MQASVLIRNNPEIKQAGFIDKFSQTLIRLGKEVPVDSDLQDLFKRVLEFEKKHRKLRR